MHVSSIGRLGIASIALLAVSTLTRGDSLLLRDGGKLEGEVAIERGSDGKIASYSIRLESGGLLAFKPSQVTRHVEPTSEERAYADLLSAMPDTAESHWKMAEFCRDKNLVEQKNFHIDRTLELNSDHPDARRARGFTWKDGQWVRQTDVMRRRGYVLYKGTWRLPQDVASIEAQEQTELAQKSWRTEMKKWRSWIGSRREPEAIQNFRSLRDPMSAMGLIELLHGEDNAGIRELLVDVLGRLPGAEATRTLASTAVFDDDEEVRVRALERLIERNDQATVAHLTVPYLRHRQNSIVNRAASVLQRMGHRETILPLIGALVTTHSKTVVPQGNVRPAFSSGPDGGGIGFSAGQSPRKISKSIHNRQVLAALVALTGQNFQYDEQAWRNWYKEQRAPTVLDLRRDL
jgi:hypothetical protein